MITPSPSDEAPKGYSGKAWHTLTDDQKTAVQHLVAQNAAVKGLENGLFEVTENGKTNIMTLKVSGENATYESVRAQIAEGFNEASNVHIDVRKSNLSHEEMEKLAKAALDDFNEGFHPAGRQTLEPAPRPRKQKRPPTLMERISQFLSSLFNGPPKR
jgi:hypothetical protein